MALRRLASLNTLDNSLLSKLKTATPTTTTTSTSTTAAPTVNLSSQTPQMDISKIQAPQAPPPPPPSTTPPAPTQDYRSSPTSGPRVSTLPPSQQRTTIDQAAQMKADLQAKTQERLSDREKSVQDEKTEQERSPYENQYLNSPIDSSKPFSDQEEGLFNDLLKSHDASWGDKQKALEYDRAKLQRRNAELNARMGGSIGGGFVGGMAQAQLASNQQMLQERNKHDDRGRDLRLSFLDKRINQRNRLDDREFQRQRALEDQGFREHLQDKEISYGMDKTRLANEYGLEDREDRQAHETDLNRYINESNNPVQDFDQKARQEQIENAVNKKGVSSKDADAAYDAYFKQKGTYPKNWKEMQSALAMAGIH